MAEQAVSPGLKIEFQSRRNAGITIVDANSLPSVPTHVPIHVPKIYLKKPTIEEELAEAMLASDDGSGNDDDDEYSSDVEISGGKNKKRKQNPSGKSYQKVADKKAEQLIETLISMNLRGSNTEQMIEFLRSLNYPDKTLSEIKSSLRKKMSTSIKGLTAKQTSMLKYLSALENDHPDKVLELQLRDPSMTFASLSKMTTEKEDRIARLELELAVEKDELKLHKFFLENHADKTTTRDACMTFLQKTFNKIENERMRAITESVAAKRSAMFGFF